MLKFLGGWLSPTTARRAQQGTTSPLWSRRTRTGPRRHHLPGGLCRPGRGDCLCATIAWPTPMAWIGPALQTQIEAADAQTGEQRVEETLQRLHLNPDARVGDLWRHQNAWPWPRRWWPGPTCCCRRTHQPPGPGLSIRWLEDRSSTSRGSVVTITHDRAFLDRIATRIVELDWASCARTRQLCRLPPKEEQLAQKPSSTPRQTSCWRRKKCGCKGVERATPAAKAALAA